jgi:hypothetical protein|tara:strand:+ start:164 stop:343 length:180 start_codon:yes stop_codon:yes gene_type:complete
MEVNHSYISIDFAELMKKELDVRETFRDYPQEVEVEYAIKRSTPLIFNLTITIKDKDGN